MKIYRFIRSYCLKLFRLKNFVLAVLTLLSLVIGNSTYALTVQRPISDWVSSQGSYLFSNINGIPIHKFVGWSNSDGSLFYLVDFAGVKARDLGLPPPIISGKVTEKALPDGTADVTVDLHASNALTYITNASVFYNNIAQCTLNPGIAFPVNVNIDFCPTLFGYSVQELALAPKGSLKPAFGDAYFTMEFINQVPTGVTVGKEPLPDLRDVIFGSALISQSISSSAFGVLRAAFGVPDGTPGRVQNVQLYFPYNPGVNNHVIPNGPLPGLINIKVVGGGTN